MAGAATSVVQRRQSVGVFFSNENIRYEEVLSVIFGIFGVKPQVLVGIQFIKVNKVIVKFGADAAFKAFLLKFAGCVSSVPTSSGGGTVKIVNLSLTTTLVTVKNAPFEMDDGVVTNALKRYGKVFFIKKHVHKSERANGIQTGTRTVKMEVRHKIPASLTVSGFTLAISYSGQSKPCFKCGAEEHLTHDCGSSVRGNSVFYDFASNKTENNETPTDTDTENNETPTTVARR